MKCVILIIILILSLFLIGCGDRELSDGTAVVDNQIKAEILEDIRTSGKKLSINQDIRLNRGEALVEEISIINKILSQQNFIVQIEPIKQQTPDRSGVIFIDTNNELSFFYNNLTMAFEPTEGRAIPVTISANDNASGTYLCSIKVYIDENDCGINNLSTCNLYDERKFFITI